MEIERRKVDELKAADYNPRKDLRPGDAEYEKLKRSIQEFGYVEPVIWNKRTGTVVGGHQRLKVMKDLGFEEVDCVVVDLDDKKEKALNIALNKISGEWDNDLLANLLKDLDGSGYDITLTGFDLAEAQELFGSGSMENVHEDDFDADSAVSEISEPKTKRGDLWILGRHRLLCGDCTQKEDVAKVLEDKYADLMVASSTELALRWAASYPRVTFYGCNSLGIGHFGDLCIYYLPNSQIVLWCPQKVFDAGIQETVGFEPDFWIDSHDVVSAVLNYISAK